MPTYEYRCTDCGHELEEFQSMSALPLVKCPQCGKDTLKRVLGVGGGMIFKGQGFYLTDYKKSGESKGSSPPKEPAKKKPDSQTGSEPPKPAKKSPEKEG